MVQQFLEWMADPASIAISLTPRQSLVVIAIVAFVFGARLQLAWSRIVAGFRSTYVPGSFAASFAKAFIEAQQARHKEAKSSDIAACAPPEPPVHLVASKTPIRESGMQQHTHG